MDPYITWPPHPDEHVEDLFRQANRDDFIIVHQDGMYTLISPDGTRDMQFLDYVVPSSGAWRAVVRQLEDWLEQMKEDSGGSDGNIQDQHQGDCQRLLRRRDGAER